MLMEEEVKLDVHKAKKCSFITTRPLIWAKTVEQHLRETENPYYSSKYTSEDGLYIEYTLYNDKTRDKKLTINIYVKTGVVLIQGEHYQFWAEKVFPILKDQVENYVVRRTFNHMGSLWNENITLKATLRSLETDYSVISKELDTVQLKSTEIVKAVKSADEEKYLCKVPGCLRHHIAEAKASSSIADLEDQISNIRTRLRRKISEIKYTTAHPGCITSHPGFVTSGTCTRHIWSDLSKIHCDLATVQNTIVHDIGDLKSRLNTIDSAFESMNELNANAVTMKKIEGEQKHINVNMESINKSLDDMKKKMKLTWYDLTI